MSAPFRAVRGKWYVSFPRLLHPDARPLGDPFDTEPQARDWLAGVGSLPGGVAWQFPADNALDVDRSQGP
jgi:hypothetical protein